MLSDPGWPEERTPGQRTSQRLVWAVHPNGDAMEAEGAPAPGQELPVEAQHKTTGSDSKLPEAGGLDQPAAGECRPLGAPPRAPATDRRLELGACQLRAVPAACPSESGTLCACCRRGRRGPQPRAVTSGAGSPTATASPPAAPCSLTSCLPAHPSCRRRCRRRCCRRGARAAHGAGDGGRSGRAGTAGAGGSGRGVFGLLFV